jgi:hypothetical protein
LFAFKYKVVNMVKLRSASSVPAAIAKRRTNNKHLQHGQTRTIIIQIQINTSTCDIPPILFEFNKKILGSFRGSGVPASPAAGRCDVDDRSIS